MYQYTHKLRIFWLDETLQDANKAPLMHVIWWKETLFLQPKDVLEKFHAWVAPQAHTRGGEKLYFRLLGLEEGGKREKRLALG
jgi:hypothetical protein